MSTVDLNCDLGEGFGVWTLGNDRAMLDLVSSANVACGFHAGDPLTLLRTCRWAAQRGVTVGAQVGYRDLAGFGRRFVDADPDELAADVLYQIGALAGLARAAGTRVGYVKPHGALYHAVGQHDGQAAAVIEAVRAFHPGLPVLGLPGSRWLDRVASAGLTPVTEAYADRGYTPAGGLVPRREPGAVLTDPAAVADRVVRLVRDGELTAIDGTVLRLAAASVCLHGDTPGAVTLARAVRRALDGAGIAVAPFTR